MRSQTVPKGPYLAQQRGRVVSMAQVEKETASDVTAPFKFKREDLRPYRYPEGKVFQVTFCHISCNPGKLSLQTAIQAIALASRGLLGTLIDGYTLSFNVQAIREQPGVIL